MGMNVTSLTGNGLRDWLIQRVSAVIVLLYFLCVGGFILANPNMNYATWHGFFMHGWLRVFSFFFMLSIVSHAWIGIWTVSTDYVKCVCLRLFLQIVVGIVLLACLGWGMLLLWGI